jgi:hypothetical protein
MTEYAPDEEEPIERHAASLSDSGTDMEDAERQPQRDQTTTEPQEGEQATSS